MSNDYRNCEGYPDPTAGEALSRIAANEKHSLRAFRPIVYICSPFSGDVETNVANARRYSRYAVDKGFATSKPHVTEISSFERHSFESRKASSNELPF